MDTRMKSPRAVDYSPFVSILVLNWNGAEVTDRCVSSLLKFTNYPKDRLKIIVVDNGSSDNSVELLTQKYSDRIELLALEENFGFIRGNNKGIKSTMGKYSPSYILLLNNDTQVVQENWLQELVNTAESDERVGIVGPRLLFPNGRVQWSGRRKEPNSPFLIFQTISAGFNPGVGKNQREAERAGFIGEANTVSGACMLVKTELFRKIGLLDERLAPMFGEDVEYSLRAWKGGYKVVYRGDVDVVHHESYTIEKFKKELQNKKTYWALRNGMIISRTYFGFWKTLVFGLPIFTLAALLDKRDKSAGLRVRNMKFRQGAVKNISLLFKAMHDGLLCRKCLPETQYENSGSE